MLDEKLSSYVRMQVLRAVRRSGWQFAFAYHSLTRSMNNNDPGYVNYEAIIYDGGRRSAGGVRVGYCTLAYSDVGNRFYDST